MFSLVLIMAPKMTTQSVGWPATASRGGGTGGRAGRGGQGSEVNDGVDGVPNFSTIISQQLQNLFPTIIAGTLTDEALRNGSIKKNPEKRGNVGEPSRIRMLDRAEGPGGNRPNLALPNNKGRGRGNRRNQERGRAFMLGAEEARHDPNIMTGMFTLNDYYATTLFDSGVDYSFVSTTFIPLLGIEPSDLGFSYEIEIASGQLVKIDKVVRGYKLEIEGHMFDINLIPFRSGSFDVIIGVDWLSNHKAEIICHEKVVRIRLLHGKVLKVIGERSDEKVRHLMSAKAKERKKEELVVVRDFPEVFPNDLSGLPLVGKSNFVLCSSLEQYRSRNLHIDWHLLKWRSCRVNLRNSKTKYFSKIDLRFGYHQLRVHEDEISNTAFRTRYGHFMFTVMPFGLTNAPATWEEHEVHLGLVLELLKDEKLYVKFSKFEFWMCEVQFLRHVINGDCIYVDPSQIEAVKNWKAPRTLSERRWIEIFSYYDCKIRYHPGKANVVADALSRKEREKPKRARSMNMTLQSGIKDRILAAQKEASDKSAGLQRGINEMIELRVMKHCICWVLIDY
nr:hypothetical protein [Tanacetum cinerariifolium]